MNAPFSAYLSENAAGLKKLLGLFRERYDYTSILASDSKGFKIAITGKNDDIENSNITTERGIVIRVHKDGLYSEYSLNRFDKDHPEASFEEASKALDAQMELLKSTETEVYFTSKLSDEPCTLSKEFETEELPETCDMGKIIDNMHELREYAKKKSENLVDIRFNLQSTHISKLFLTANRDMRQSYVYSEGNVIPIKSSEAKTVYSYEGISGRVGPELFAGMKDIVDKALRTADEEISASAVEPGEYDVITCPDVTGLIAHEAFGHGVEMDMFVKDRALGAKYIGKRVGSDKVTMHEGANCAVDVTSYAFDDEGTLAGDVTEIDHGILRTGICDALSALRLGTEPTGNGKRQNFEHKVYSRMTNTVFDSGTDTLEDMIKSIKFGYLLEEMASGMEDPKHWGIQCIVERGYEINDGKLTGKVVSPVVMTGYVPDVLGSVSMVSTDRKVYGNGMCGKGCKEWVKVADGGPYLKLRARLG